MLFMVIERYASGTVDAVGARFREKGRMMPDDIRYVASWLVPSGAVCYQLMEAPNAEALQPWLDAWSDLVKFEVTPVLTSADFWQQR